MAMVYLSKEVTLLIVLSLCDGMSCGQIALEKCGNNVDKYFASEIKEVAVKVTMYNYPNTIQIGDVTKISYKNGVLFTENRTFKTNIDMVMFGSPCQTFSCAMKSPTRTGLDNKSKSGLFLECYRISKEINPTYFFVENVASMKKTDKEFLSDCLGVQPILIDSATISACNRKRLYWTNIKGVKPPKSKDIYLQDILEDGYTDLNKARCLLASDCRQLVTPSKMFHRYYLVGFTTLIFKNKRHYNRCLKHYKDTYEGLSVEFIPSDETTIYNGVRYLTQKERELCHGIPLGYTSVLEKNDAFNVIGDGWQVDTIVYILNYLNINS